MHKLWNLQYNLISFILTKTEKIDQKTYYVAFPVLSDVETDSLC